MRSKYIERLNLVVGAASLALSVTFFTLAIGACGAPESTPDPISSEGTGPEDEEDAALDAGPEDEQLGESESALESCEKVSIDPSRSLFVTDDAVLAKFDLARVMQQLVKRARTQQTPLELYQQWWDTQNDKARAVTGGPHCDDKNKTLNGFPLDCPRQEGVLAKTNPFAGGPDGYHPTAVINRFDLAPIDGSNCGEYRITYGKNSGNPPSSLFDRNLLIFEAVLPNPNPSAGLEACRPVAKFWAELSKDTNPASRAQKLEKFYFTGLSGFEPVVDATHYGLNSTARRGAGQIRTNQFMFAREQQAWELREFRLSRTCGPIGPGAPQKCRLVFTPTTVKNNPFGPLFSSSGAPSASKALTQRFQRIDFLAQVKDLAGADPNVIGMATPGIYDNGQSRSQLETGETIPENDYVQHFDDESAFADAIRQALVRINRTDLTAEDIVNRATTQSCGGCHEFSSGKPVGGGVTWPASNRFTHIDENKKLSPALKEVFLPHRKQVLQSFVNACRDATKIVFAQIGGKTPGAEVVIPLPSSSDDAPVKDDRPIGGGSGVH